MKYCECGGVFTYAITEDNEVHELCPICDLGEDYLTLQMRNGSTIAVSRSVKELAKSLVKMNEGMSTLSESTQKSIDEIIKIRAGLTEEEREQWVLVWNEVM